MQQGKGIGSLLLKAVITEHVQQHGRCLGLLVDMDNPAAKKLYLRLGFNVTGTRSLMGKQLEHLRYEA